MKLQANYYYKKGCLELINENELEPYTISTDSLRLMYQSPVTTAEGDRKISQNNDKEAKTGFTV